ncbi:MAG: DegV family protein [Oscillospiraceae bacterium]|nr:DegV family protein [Oscillospiraceae bacterium]
MVRIITDSAADFEPFELEKLHIDCIPIKVMVGGTEYEENVDLSKDQFFQLLADTGATPKTSQPAPHILMDLFAQAKAAGEEAVYITLSSALSGTYQTACMTAEDTDSENVFVLDSRNATGGQRLLVEYAVRLRDEGKSAKEIVDAVAALRDKIVLYACIDTLEYLYRGGRISQTVYKLGTMAQVKPVIRVSEEGGIEVPAKAMGMRKGMDMLCKRIEQQKPSAEHNFYVMYTADRKIGQTLAEKVRTMGYDIPEERIIQVGAGIGSHIGPNACGIVYVEE